MTKRQTIGSGMTKRRLKDVDVLTWFNEEADHNDKYPDPFDAHIAGTEEMARAILGDAAIPLQASATRMLLEVEEQGFEPYDKPEWYAARILFEIVGVRAAINRKDVSGAVIKAAQLGELINEAVMKFDWEADAISGRKIAQGNRDRRDKYNQERKISADQWKSEAQRFADEYWQRHPDAPNTEVAGKVQAYLIRKGILQPAAKTRLERPYTFNTIRQVIKKPDGAS